MLTAIAQAKLNVKQSPSNRFRKSWTKCHSRHISYTRSIQHHSRQSAAQVLHGELWGDRDTKYRQLWDGTVPALIATDVSPQAAPWRFKPTDKVLEAAYLAGFSVADLFSPNGRPAPGIVTTHDEFAISWSAVEAAEKVELLLATATEADARQLFRLCSQSQWNYAAAKVALADGAWRQAITPIAYRPFDTRFTVYNSHVAVHRRNRVMSHIFGHQNLALLVTKAVRDSEYAHCFLTDTCNEVIFLSGVSASNAMSLPLYLFPEEGTLDQSIRVNFEPKLYGKIRAMAGLSGTPAVPGGTNAFRQAIGDERPDEVKVFDYIYGVLHSPAYRARYAEFLKIDFPRIPFPASSESFRAISEQGEALRRLHLMENAAIGATPYSFHGDSDSVVDKARHENEQVWVNADQYFDGVPAIAWGFRIGGYQPAQKWLKDRKGRALTYEDIRHYQRIIKILVETDRIMRTIDLPHMPMRYDPLANETADNS